MKTLHLLISGILAASPQHAASQEPPASPPEPARLREPTSLTVTTFNEIGSVCLPDADQKTLLSKLAELHLGSDVAITLIAHSDAVGIRTGATPDVCIDTPLPEGLIGHERIAALRALHVYDVAKKANVPGFSGPPVIVLTPGEHRFVSTDNTVVSILLRRAAQENRTSRHVDLIATPRPINALSVNPQISFQPQVQVQPAPAPQVVVNSSDETPKAFGRLQVGLGVSMLLLGIASVATSVAFGIGAYRQSQASKLELDPARSVALESDGFRYARAAGVLGGFGVGLTLGGAILTHRGRTQLGKTRKQRK